MTRVVGVSLKMYFGVEQTRRWLQSVAALAREDGALRQPELFVAPSFLSLLTARDLLAGTDARLAAEDVFWEDAGPFTGEVSASMLREAGCTYVEIGHAERRRLFAEDEGVTARKAAAVAGAGLVPLVCVGETEPTDPDAAARTCAAQLEPVLRAVSPNAELLFAYVPVWAIGAAAPAPADHVLGVALSLRQRFAGRAGRTRLIYGAAPGPARRTPRRGCRRPVPRALRARHREPASGPRRGERMRLSAPATRWTWASRGGRRER